MTMQLCVFQGSAIYRACLFAACACKLNAPAALADAYRALPSSLSNLFIPYKRMFCQSTNTSPLPTQPISVEPTKSKVRGLSFSKLNRYRLNLQSPRYGGRPCKTQPISVEPANH